MLESIKRFFGRFVKKEQVTPSLEEMVESKSEEVKTEGVKKVTFGNSNLIVKESRKCSQKTDRTTAGYWSCNLGRYSKQLGLSSSNY